MEGIAFGAAGGFEYKLARRLSLAIDLGPNVLALKETTPKTDQTNLDFIINTALPVHLF